MKNITQKILTSVTALTMIVGATSVVPPVHAANNGWTGSRAQYCALAHESSDGKMEFQNSCTVYDKEGDSSIIVHIHDFTALHVRKGPRPGLVTIDDTEGVWKFDGIACGFQFTQTDKTGTTTYTVKGICN